MKAVIMAGGRGTRLMPLTGDLPKPMVKLIDKPVLEYIILLLKKHGVTDVAITLGYMPERIISYFGNGENLGVEITYFIEKTPLGTAGGVKKAENFLSDDFIVMSGDAYTEIDLSKAAAFHKAKNSLFTLVAHPHPNPEGLGVLNVDFENRVTEFIEKPKNPVPSLINTGIYVINKKILDMIPEGFYDFGKNLLPRLVLSAYAYVDYAYWSDIGTLVSYYETNGYLAQKLADKALLKV
jgi:mannose-1-phosphate guanylyltransferase/phosphomannomutase